MSGPISRALTSSAILARLLGLGRGPSADVVHAAAPPESAGIAVLSAQSTADLQRLTRTPSPTRLFSDTFRMR